MALPYAEVIGDPIAHSKSPLIHRFWLAKLRIEGDYRTCHVRADGLARYFTARRNDPAWRGCNITVPYKVSATSLLDRIDSLAHQVGAINTAIPTHAGLTGHNTDVAGIRESFASLEKMPLPPNHVATLIDVIGAGGAARAVGAAFRGGEITFYNRSLDKAVALANEFSAGSDHGFAQTLDSLRKGPPVNDPAFPDVRINRGEDQRYSYIVINTSTMGMAGQPEVPIDLDWYPENTIVFDAVYAPLETGLLKAARDRGLRTIDGLHMLIGQAAAAFELFFGTPAPREHDAELRALLTA